MKRVFLKNKQSGASLVEMLIAISIVVVALLGILTLINRSLGLNRVTNEFYTGTYLAAEGIEIVKNMFDRSFLQVTNDNATRGNQNFYGWTGTDSIAPGGRYEISEVDFDDITLTKKSCILLNNDPTEDAVRKLILSCANLKFLNFDRSSGIYSYNSGGEQTKFKRVIIIDKPEEFKGATVNLDYRVTSVVGWESRGGKFVVQLQDHFLPWRLP